MVFAIAMLTFLMLAIIGWLTIFRLRRERVETERELTRGRFAFRPRERARYLLGQSFPVAQERAPWEEGLVSRLEKPRYQHRDE